MYFWLTNLIMCRKNLTIFLKIFFEDFEILFQIFGGIEFVSIKKKSNFHTKRYLG